MTSAPVLTGQDLAEVSGAVHAMLEAALAGTRLTAEEFVALQLLHQRPTMSPSEFAAYLLSQRQSRLDAERAFARVALLAEKGLVEPLAHGEPVTPSPRGEALYREQLARVQALAGELYGEIDPQELATTKRVLTRLGSRAGELAENLRE